MSNDFSTSYDAIGQIGLPLQSDTAITEKTASRDISFDGILSLNSVLEGGAIPHSTADIKLPKSAWKQIRARLGAVL